MRVVFLSLTHRYDDTRILHKEARALAERGYEVFHLAPDYGKPAPSAVHGVAVRLFGSPGLSRAHRLRALWREARRLNADVYHCNEVESWLVGCTLKVFRPGCRIVFDVHEHYPSRFTEHPELPLWLRWVGGPTLKGLFRLLTPWTDHIVFAKRSVAPDFHTKPGRSSFVFNYASSHLTVPARGSVSPEIVRMFAGRPTAIHIGGFSRQRGWPQLLEALTQTRNSDLRVVAIGDVQEGTEALMEEAKRLRVADRILIVGRVEYDKLFDYLACADVGLLLYQPGILNHVYAFPMKLYDYMLAGLPVIGPNFAPEVTPVIDGEDIGWLIDTADPREIARALDSVADDPARAHAMGERARKAAEETYTWEREAEKLVCIYAGLKPKARQATPSHSPAAS